MIHVPDRVLLSLCFLYFFLFCSDKLPLLPIDLSYFLIDAPQLVLGFFVIILYFTSNGLFGVNFGRNLVLETSNLRLEVSYELGLPVYDDLLILQELRILLTIEIISHEAYFS